MSFSRDVKEEISHQMGSARHCRLAELAAILHMEGELVAITPNRYYLEIYTENLTVAEKCFILIKKSFHVVPEVALRSYNGKATGVGYAIVIKKEEVIHSILMALKVMDENGDFLDLPEAVSRQVVQNICCKRAFLRGAFLVCGSISDPEKAYHMEMVTEDEKMADVLCDVMKSFDVEAKTILRKKNYVVYLKEGAQISTMLSIMEAHVAMMNMENIRILKDVRNSVNRKVNCETANISKTVGAATRQIQDIEYIRDTKGFGELTDALREIAQKRLLYPDVSLKELGSLLNPPIGKSGVNHRLRKLSEIAEQLHNSRRK